MIPLSCWHKDMPPIRLSNLVRFQSFDLITFQLSEYNFGKSGSIKQITPAKFGTTLILVRNKSRDIMR